MVHSKFHVSYRPVSKQHSLVEFQNCMSVLTVLSGTQCREEMMEDMLMILTHESLMMNFVNGLRQSASFNRILVY